MTTKNRLRIINEAFPLSYKKFLALAKKLGYASKTSGLDKSCIASILKRKASYVQVLTKCFPSFHTRVFVCIDNVYFYLPLYKVLAYSKKILLDGRQKILNYVHSLLHHCLEGVPESVKLIGYNLPKGTVQVIDSSRQDGIVTLNMRKRGWHNTWKSFYEIHLSEKQRLRIKQERSTEKRFNVLQKKLQQLSTVTVSIRENDYNEKDGLVKLWYKNTQPFFVRNNFFVEITLGDLSRVEAKKDKLLRHIIAYFRYNHSLIPVYTSDSSYCAEVLKKTCGTFIPSDGKYHSTQHGDPIRNKLKCVKCGAIRDIPKSGIFPTTCRVCNPKRSKNYSRQCIEWLKDIECRFHINILHAENGGEVPIDLGKLGKHYVDGYSKTGNIVFEYHGSRWHGNPLCFYMDDKCNPYSKSITAYDLLLKTIRLERKIVKLGYTYVRIWDCDYLDKRRYAQWLVKNTKRIQTAIKP